MAFQEEADVLEGYRLLCFIGQGSFSHVQLALHLRTGSEVAVKVIPRDPEDSASLQKLLGEVDLMKGLHHPHIIELLEVRHTADCTYLIMEYASRGELRCYVAERGHLWEEEARFLFGQILSAVHYCHGRRVVHRDLKLGNLLLDAGLNIKLPPAGRPSRGGALEPSCLRVVGFSLL
uniref:non-specific serine/threonine protein kinase n=1 Tax=Oryctolagus cuniculus TaxID=9986 RepID=A0A5F9CNV8_RABIT